MPFICKFILNNGALASGDEVVFLSFVDESFGKFQSNRIKIAKVMFNGHKAFIYSTCPCFPSTKAGLIYGDKISATTIIGYFAANGEDIPYDKPYASIEI